MKYKVIHSDEKDGTKEFEEKVQHMIDQGWRPQGGVIVYYAPISLIYFQAMTKEA